MDVFSASRMRRTAVRPVPIRAAKALMERLSSSIFWRIDAARERLSSSSGETADRVGMGVGWFTFGPVSKLELEPRRPTSFARVLCATGIRPMVGLVRISEKGVRKRGQFLVLICEAETGSGNEFRIWEMRSVECLHLFP